MNVYLVLTQAQFDNLNDYLNSENGWPDGNGTERYATPFQFSMYSNCPPQYRDKVGLVLDKAMIRNIQNISENESKPQKALRMFNSLDARINNNPNAVIRVEDTSTDIESEITDNFTSAIDEIEQILSEMVS